MRSLESRSRAKINLLSAPDCQVVIDFPRIAAALSLATDACHEPPSSVRIVLSRCLRHIKPDSGPGRYTAQQDVADAANTVLQPAQMHSAQMLTAAVPARPAVSSCVHAGYYRVVGVPPAA